MDEVEAQDLLRRLRKLNPSQYVSAMLSLRDAVHAEEALSAAKRRLLGSGHLPSS